MDLAINQLTPQPPWAYCESPEDIWVKIREERERDLSIVAFKGVTGSGGCQRWPPRLRVSISENLTWTFQVGIWHIPSSNLNHILKPIVYIKVVTSEVMTEDFLYLSLYSNSFGNLNKY